MLSSLIECDAKHKSLFSATPVFVHHHVFLGFFARRRVGGTRRRHHTDQWILPRTRGNSNDKVPTFFTSQYSLVGVTRGCKGQSSTYFISILSVVGRIREGLAVSLRLRVSDSVCPDGKGRGL